MRPEQEFALQWLHKAKNDLLSAKVVLASEFGITDVPCFHAQQTVEKAFKGFLTHYGMAFGRTHDLMLLLAEVTEIASEFEDLHSICAELSEFSVEVRYPGGISEPPEGEAAYFVQEAEKILIRVKEAITSKK